MHHICYKISWLLGTFFSLIKRGCGDKLFTNIGRDKIRNEFQNDLPHSVMVGHLLFGKKSTILQSRKTFTEINGILSKCSTAILSPEHNRWVNIVLSLNFQKYLDTLKWVK